MSLNVCGCLVLVPADSVAGGGEDGGRYLQSLVQACRSSYYWYKIRVSTSSPCTHKGNADLIAFTFLFYLHPHPTFQNPGGWELFADTPFGLFFLPAPAWLPHISLPGGTSFPCVSSPFLCGGPWMPRRRLPAKLQGLLNYPGPQGPPREGWRRRGSAGHLSGL